jgi:predicted SAM-dependent methyltransferase
MSTRAKFGTKFYNLTLYKLLKFEILSFIKRLFNPKKITADRKYIQLGCGPDDVKNNFINLDFNSDNKNNVIFSDFRYPLSFENNSFFGTFSEHALEHLNSFDSIKFLSEVHRILTPDSIFRIVVPDLDIYVKYYNKQISNVHLDNFKNGCEAIWNVTQNWGHLSVWNYEMIELQLKNIGFKKIYKKNFKEGINPDLLIDKEGRQHESLYIEAIK